jgi:hypothetical protein
MTAGRGPAPPPPWTGSLHAPTCTGRTGTRKARAFNGRQIEQPAWARKNLARRLHPARQSRRLGCDARSHTKTCPGRQDRCPRGGFIQHRRRHSKSSLLAAPARAGQGTCCAKARGWPGRSTSAPATLLCTAPCPRISGSWSTTATPLLPRQFLTFAAGRINQRRIVVQEETPTGWKAARPKPAPQRMGKEGAAAERCPSRKG